MTTYIPMQMAMNMISNAYLVSVIVILAVSYIGWTAIETIEKADSNSPLSKWFI